MSKIIDFEKHQTVMLTRVADENPLLTTYADADGQKYVAMANGHGTCLIPLFDDCNQIIAYEEKYGGIKRKFALSPVQATGGAK